MPVPHTRHLSHPSVGARVVNGRRSQRYLAGSYPDNGRLSGRARRARAVFVWLQASWLCCAAMPGIAPKQTLAVRGLARRVVSGRCPATSPRPPGPRPAEEGVEAETAESKPVLPSPPLFPGRTDDPV
jgi:hypothetical protein